MRSFVSKVAYRLSTRTTNINSTTVPTSRSLLPFTNAILQLTKTSFPRGIKTSHSHGRGESVFAGRSIPFGAFSHVHFYIKRNSCYAGFLRRRSTAFDRGHINSIRPTLTFPLSRRPDTNVDLPDYPLSPAYRTDVENMCPLTAAADSRYLLSYGQSSELSKRQPRRDAGR